MSDCTTIASRRREGKQVAPSVLKDDAPTKRPFDELHFIVERLEESDDDLGKFYLSLCNMSSFYVGDYG